MSNRTDLERKSKIRKGEPIEYKGLIFYPIKMSHYEEFMGVKDAIVTRQSTLPIKYLSMNYISALWALDIDSQMATGKAIGLFERVLRFMYLSLRLEYNIENIAGAIYYDSNDASKLIRIDIRQGSNNVSLSPQDISLDVRRILAEQNGLELPDESYNPDLVQAERDIKQIRSENLKYDIDTLISSVAYLSNISENEINDWTVLQFNNRVRAIERDKSYMLYHQAELSGMVKFPKGNPCPSWCYDKESSLSPALRSVRDVNKNVSAVGDINEAVKKAQISQQKNKE